MAGALRAIEPRNRPRYAVLGLIRSVCMFEVICVSFAFVFGLAVRQLGLPPMVGFLTAGFAINALGPVLRLPEATGDWSAP